MESQYVTLCIFLGSLIGLVTALLFISKTRISITPKDNNTPNYEPPVIEPSSILPEEYINKSKLLDRESLVYIVPWTTEIDCYGQGWINNEHQAYDFPQGTASLPVEKTDDGYIVYLSNFKCFGKKYCWDKNNYPMTNPDYQKVILFK